MTTRMTMRTTLSWTRNYLLCKVQELAKKSGETQIYPKTVPFGGRPILAPKHLLFFVENLQNFILVLDDRQERSLQVARMFRPARRQPALRQEGTGRHDDISIHSGSFLRWLVAKL